jgi:acyl-CoA oxidase
LFANPGDRHHDVIKTLCVIKAMVTWHNEKTARICRERCGGGGFLEYNILPMSLFGAHSGMTAEGDNSVLMQKVVKDIMVHTRGGKHKVPKISKSRVQEISQLSDVTADFEALRDLIFVKE